MPLALLVLIRLSLIPLGMSGLKLDSLQKRAAVVESHPAWDEWIEILPLALLVLIRLSLIPLGMSGLKLDSLQKRAAVVESHPAWDEWIEI